MRGTPFPGDRLVSEKLTSNRSALWLDPSFGVSGDMMLGALVGLGADIDLVRQSLSSLDIDGWSISSSVVQRCGLASTRVEVETSESHRHRMWSTIDSLIANSSLSDFVISGARRTFRRLGEVEAMQHSTSIDEVHFHEVGAVDAIVDIVGAWIALEQLDVAQVHAGPVGLGHGTVEAAHGLLPLPAPATVALLEGVNVLGLEFEGETTTPTGAALVATMATHFSPLPEGSILNTARGAGGRDPAGHPNVTSAIIVELADGPSTSDEGSPALELVTNVDDVTPEVLGYLITKLIDAGADDAWVVPIQMKKSRPAHQLRVLTSPELAAEMREIMSVETGSLGIRQFETTKFVLPRRVATIELRGCEVRVKIGPHGIKPEHDDLAQVAAKLGLPLRQLAAEALQVAAASELGHNHFHESSSS